MMISDSSPTTTGQIQMLGRQSSAFGWICGTSPSRAMSKATRMCGRKKMGGGRMPLSKGMRKRRKNQPVRWVMPREAPSWMML